MTLNLTELLPPFQIISLPTLANVSLSVGSVHLSGLDSFGQVELLKPNASAGETHTLANRLSLKNFRVAVSLSITITPTDDVLNTFTLTEAFNLELDAEASRLPLASSPTTYYLLLTTYYWLSTLST